MLTDGAARLALGGRMPLLRYGTPDRHCGTVLMLRSPWALANAKNGHRNGAAGKPLPARACPPSAHAVLGRVEALQVRWPFRRCDRHNKPCEPEIGGGKQTKSRLQPLCCDKLVAT